MDEKQSPDEKRAFEVLKELGNAYVLNGGFLYPRQVQRGQTVLATLRGVESSLAGDDRRHFGAMLTRAIRGAGLTQDLIEKGDFTRKQREKYEDNRLDGSGPVKKTKVLRTGTDVTERPEPLSTALDALDDKFLKPQTPKRKERYQSPTPQSSTIVLSEKSVPFSLTTPNSLTSSLSDKNKTGRNVRFDPSLYIPDLEGDGQESGGGRIPRLPKLLPKPRGSLRRQTTVGSRFPTTTTTTTPETSPMTVAQIVDLVSPVVIDLTQDPDTPASEKTPMTASEIVDLVAPLVKSEVGAIPTRRTQRQTKFERPKGNKGKGKGKTKIKKENIKQEIKQEIKKEPTYNVTAEQVQQILLESIRQQQRQGQIKEEPTTPVPYAQYPPYVYKAPTRLSQSDMAMELEPKEESKPETTTPEPQPDTMDTSGDDDRVNYRYARASKSRAGGGGGRAARRGKTRFVKKTEPFQFSSRSLRLFGKYSGKKKPKKFRQFANDDGDEDDDDDDDDEDEYNRKFF